MKKAYQSPQLRVEAITMVQPLCASELGINAEQGDTQRIKGLDDLTTESNAWETGSLW